MGLKPKFDVLIITGRPAAGKSEVIDFLAKSSDAERLDQFKIAPFEEIDDFRYVWDTFETDDILQKHGKPRLNTTRDYYFKDPFIWTLYIEKINLEFKKKEARDPLYFKKTTLLVEFARGGEHGLRDAFANLDPELLKKAAVLYIHVSYDESLRRNRKRFRPGEADSILHHSLPDEKMEFYYKISDWEKLAPNQEGKLLVQGIEVPYAVFENESGATDDPKTLRPALKETLERLWKAKTNGG